MPQVGSPNAQSDSMAAGVDTLTKGIGQMLRNRNAEKWHEQQQANWERQFAQNKAVQDASLRRQQEQDEWMRRVYEFLAGSDPEEARYQELMEKYYGNGGGEVGLIAGGLNPKLM
jgi:O-methyltransferase involved in polyketide biosynthesis